MSKVESFNENAVNPTASEEKAVYEENMRAGGAKKPYTFRRLNSTDLFPMIRIISKIGVDELADVFDGKTIKGIMEKSRKTAGNLEGEEKPENDAEGKEKKGEAITFAAGIGVASKMANKILEHIPSCEQEIYTLLARVSSMSEEEIMELPLNVFFEMILDFCKKDEFMDFFKVASGYINMGN